MTGWPIIWFYQWRDLSFLNMVLALVVLTVVLFLLDGLCIDLTWQSHIVGLVVVYSLSGVCLGSLDGLCEWFWLVVLATVVVGIIIDYVTFWVTFPVVGGKHKTCVVQLTKTVRFGQRNFRSSGPTIWNSSRNLWLQSHSWTVQEHTQRPSILRYIFSLWLTDLGVLQLSSSFETLLRGALYMSVTYLLTYFMQVTVIYYEGDRRLCGLCCL